VAHRWDAKTYDSLPLPHTRWGDGVLGRLTLTGTETVLDAGAGTGRDTAKLLALLPKGRVVAVDGSDTMLDRLGDDPRVRVINGDLTTPLPVGTDLDAAISVATFHCSHDHDALFANIASYPPARSSARPATISRERATEVVGCGVDGGEAMIAWKR
jgi:trans-aconitate 2-methyltransferase